MKLPGMNPPVRALLLFACALAPCIGAARGVLHVQASGPPPPVTRRPGPPDTAGGIPSNPDETDDPRLYRKIDVDLEGGDLREFAAALSQKTGALFSADKGIADWKLTVLAEGQPARDLMRQAARLFNLEWRRYGEEGHYRYHLVQTLKKKLEEDDLRNRDKDQMLLNLTKSLEPVMGYLDLSDEELRERAQEAHNKWQAGGATQDTIPWMREEALFKELASRGEEAEQSGFFDGGGKGPYLFYRALTPAQLASLKNDEEVTLAMRGGDGRLPPAMVERWRAELMRRLNGSNKPVSNADLPPEKVLFTVRFDLKHPSHDRVQLEENIQASPEIPGLDRYMIDNGKVLASVQPDRLEAPDNEKSHQGLEESAEYARKLTLEPAAESAAKAIPPTPSVPTSVISESQDADPFPVDPSWVDSAVVLKEIHRQTHRPIVADYYLRVMQNRAFFFHDQPLLKVLNRTADRMQSEWQPDGPFLRFRRVNYYAERALDVPNPLLDRWKSVQDRQGSLSLVEYGEMAGLPDAVLDCDPLKDAVRWKYGLEGWQIARNGRGVLRFYHALDPDMQRLAQTDEGVSLARLRPEAAAMLRQESLWPSDMGPPTPDQLRQARFQIRRLEPGSYTWVHREIPLFPAKVEAEGKTRAEVEAAVEKRVKERGASEATLAREKSGITGPRERILFRLQAGAWKNPDPGPDEMYLQGEIGPRASNMMGRSLPRPKADSPDARVKEPLPDRVEAVSPGASNGGNFGNFILLTP